MSILEWLYALINHWQNWASGGGMGGLVLIGLNIFDVKLSRNRKIFIFLWCFMLGSSYMAWLEMKEKVDQQQADFDQNSPHLRCEMDAITPEKNYSMYLDGKPVPFTVITTPMILNTGSPSVARNFRLKVTTENAGTYEGKPGLLEGPLKRMTNNGEMTYGPGDNLSEKANSPIPKGGEQTGILPFRVSGIPYSEVENRATVELTFSDVTGKDSSCKLLTNGRNSHGLEMMPGHTPQPPELKQQ
jgi:hypothetical protein